MGEILGDGAWTKEKMQEMIPQASDHEPVLEIELKPLAGRDMLSELRRHNRELKKVRAFIRSGSQKMNLSVVFWHILRECMRWRKV